VTTPADQNERSALRSAADRLELDDAGAHVVSSTSRIIWHLPGPGVAVLISRPRAKRFADVEAEASAVRIATDAGARTPRLVAGPVPLDDERIALAYDWIEGRALAAADWPAAAREFAALARGTAADLAVLHWPADLPDDRWADVLGAELHATFAERCRLAATTIRTMTASRDALVLCHGDIQPANVIVDPVGVPWLLDFEYSCLAPREWDPAKVVILGRRFDDPHNVDDVLASWPALDPARVVECVRAQETLLVAWLARMALDGSPGAAAEARKRARSLDGDDLPWRHLR